MRNWAIITILLFSLQLQAQEPSGTWVMAHIKAKQPVLSATMEQGELVFDEGLPYDSSEVYTPGLMVVEFDNDQTARSFSWDGDENWSWSLMQDSLLMFGKKDTLYGHFEASRIVLSSTIDAVPTEYTFLKIEDGLEMGPVTPGSEAQMLAEGHPFDQLKITFEQDTVIAAANNIPGLELYLTTIGPLQVIEYAMDRDYGKVELGMIYLFREKRKKYRGYFYPVIDDFRKPKEMEMELRF